MERQRALHAAGSLDTASEARFQTQLPFEPVNRPRLEVFKAERAAERATAAAGPGRFADRRRQAQLAARHALQAIGAGLRAHPLPTTDRERIIADALHAAELQLPDAWLPFVVSR